MSHSMTNNKPSREKICVPLATRFLCKLCFRYFKGILEILLSAGTKYEKKNYKKCATLQAKIAYAVTDKIYITDAYISQSTTIKAELRASGSFEELQLLHSA